VLGVALFGSLIGQKDAFLFGARMALIISVVLLVAAAAIALGGRVGR
jgi:DHA2 family methylenomycin A resistance protein-like MFS transporter